MKTFAIIMITGLLYSCQTTRQSIQIINSFAPSTDQSCIFVDSMKINSIRYDDTENVFLFGVHINGHVHQTHSTTIDKLYISQESLLDETGSLYVLISMTPMFSGECVYFSVPAVKHIDSDFEVDIPYKISSYQIGDNKFVFTARSKKEIVTLTRP